MAKLLKLRRGTTSQHSSFTGAEGEVTVDTTKDTVVVHDGSTAGGHPLAKESTVPTTITVADESTDTSCNVLFATAATGNLAPKSGTNLTFNSNTGILTATGFAGDITGDVTGNTSGSSGSCTGNAASATAATTATNVTVADESTDTSCNVLFTTAATGDLPPKSGTNLTFNSNTGLLTATGFSGALTGNVTGNVSGSAATVTTAAQTNITSVGTLTGITIDGAYEQVAEAVGALEIDCSTGNYFTKTISGNSTFTFANPASSGTVTSFTLELTHSSGTVTWPASVKWNADTAPTLTTGKTHLFMFVTDDGGTRYRGSALVDYVN